MTKNMIDFLKKVQELATENNTIVADFKFGNNSTTGKIEYNSLVIKFYEKKAEV